MHGLAKLNGTLLYSGRSRVTPHRIVNAVTLSPIASIALIFAAAATLTMLALSADGLFIERYFADLRVLANAMMLVKLHLTPQADVVGPLGPAFYWPYIPFAADGMFSAKDILHANLVVAWVAASLSAFLLVGLARPIIAVVLCISAFLLCCTPRDSDTLFVLSHLAPYNRWGSAFALPVAFFALAPADARTKERWWRVGAAGLCLFLLLFVKITFFFGICALLAAAAVVGLVRIRTVALIVACAVLCAGALNLLAHNVVPYLHDVIKTAEVSFTSPTRSRFWRAERHFVSGSLYGLIFISILWLRCPPLRFSAPSLMDWCIGRYQPILAGGIMIGVAMLIMLQNHPLWESALLTASALLAWEWSERQNATGAVPARGRGRADWARIALACVGGLTPALLDTVALARHSYQTHFNSSPVAVFAGTPWSDLKIPRQRPAGGAVEVAQITEALKRTPFPSKTWEFYDDLARTTEGMTMLRGHVGPSDVVLSILHSNEFPALLGLRLPRLDMQWWDFGRTFNQQIHIPPDDLLGTVTILLAPKVGLRTGGFAGDDRGDKWMNIYGDYVRAHFVQTDATEYWTAWRRR
jgi:hypothetical protein